MLRYRLQSVTGPTDSDRSYDTLSAAKGQVTRYARQFRSFGWLVVDQVTQDVYRYDREKREIVKNVGVQRLG